MNKILRPLNNKHSLKLKAILKILLQMDWRAQQFTIEHIKKMIPFLTIPQNLRKQLKVPTPKKRWILIRSIGNMQTPSKSSRSRFRRLVK